ncbi:MAG: SGNH hydrolase domain-containing protein, partial [Pseudomonadota bacterium]
FFAFDNYGTDKGVSGRLATMPSCAPLLGVARSPDCIAFNDRIVAYLDTADPMDVFVMGWWAYYAEGLRNFGTTRGEVPLVLAVGREAPDTFAAFADGLDAMLARVAQRHRVIVINSIPKYETSVPKAMVRALRFGTDLPVLTRAEFDAVQGRATQAVADLAAKHDALLVEPHRVFCDDRLCQMAQDGLPLYMDQVHLSVTGNALLLQIVMDRLEMRP